MAEDFAFAASVTAPIFCMLALGILFRRIGWVTEEFSRVGAALVFRVTLPCMLFVKLAETDFRQNLPFLLVGYALAATFLVYLLLEYLCSPRLQDIADRGVFVQGAFRSNMGIVGLAFCLSAFGEGAVGTVSIYLACVTVLFNVLAVLTLSRHQPEVDGQAALGRVLKGVAKNPLIIGICLGVLVSLFRITVPDLLLETGNYLARMTLPLALLCAGASIRLQDFQGSKSLYAAVTAKLVVVPLLITLGGGLVGLRGESLGILYLMSSAPTAAASYPMTRAMGGNYHLAAAIIAAASLASMLTTTMGLFLLRSLALL